MTDERALTTTPTFARDHASARPGEIVAVDAKGEMLTPERVRRAELFGKAAGYAVIVGGAGIGLLLGGFVGAFAATFGAAVVLRATTRDALLASAVFKEVNAHVFAGRRDEARAALGRLPARRWRGPLEAARLAMEASVAAMFGEHAQAIAKGEAALALATAPSQVVFRDAARMSIAMSYAARGEVAKARFQRVQVVGDKLAPVLQLYLAGADLLIAFAAQAPRDLPPDERLHEWAHLALEFHNSGFALLGLAWAFAQRGDHEMARHLLDSVEHRSDAGYLADAYPALVAWRTSYTVGESSS